ncbi:MAG: type II 3-dehydroquinate dehydratase [Acholeplasmataceae bacterium]
MNICVIHGPNLNKLAYRNPLIYGGLSLEGLYKKLTDAFEDIDFTFYQSNHEGDLIDVILSTLETPYDAIIINPGAYAHTSIAIRDALEMIKITKIEVHLSDLSKREAFRQIDYIKDVCDAHFMGRQFESYMDAVRYIISKKND